jgi:hypothetical protein
MKSDKSSFFKKSMQLVNHYDTLQTAWLSSGSRRHRMPIVYVDPECHSRTYVQSFLFWVIWVSMPWPKCLDWDIWIEIPGPKCLDCDSGKSEKILVS